MEVLDKFYIVDTPQHEYQDVQINDILIMEQEPYDKYGCDTIKIYTKDEVLLGYMPAKHTAFYTLVIDKFDLECILINVNQKSKHEIFEVKIIHYPKKDYDE